ncbi:B3 domain-containing transcription factor LEC2-like isoform X2 [Tasmannia lanceolata]|uniref:B3 domain-containing transcription factor LEC2-like isoform X2 n=1 Tax=Tasmannia lanceolata TaxID=3420 RepID=UPI004063C82A
MANTNPNNTPTIRNTPQNQTHELNRNMDFGFSLPPPFSPPFIPYPTHHDENHFPFVSTDFPPIFPVYPVLDEQSSSSLNFLDGFFPDLPLITPEPLVVKVKEVVAVQSNTEGLAKTCILEREWGSSITKAARSKRRIARRNSSNFRFGQRNSFSWASCRPSRKRAPLVLSENLLRDIISHSNPDNKKLSFLLQKELRNSDVSSLGRIVLPKRDAEANLPFLLVKEGIQIPVRDTDSPSVWIMRYRYWPNNKSRMYVLENTGDFVKQYDLKSGDYVMFYQDEGNHLSLSLRSSVMAPRMGQMARVAVQDAMEKSQEEILAFRRQVEELTG